MPIVCIWAITDYLLRVWKLVEKDGVYSLVLFWGTGMNRLTMGDASLEGVVGLNTANLELLKQRRCQCLNDV